MTEKDEEQAVVTARHGVLTEKEQRVRRGQLSRSLVLRFGVPREMIEGSFNEATARASQLYAFGPKGRCR